MKNWLPSLKSDSEKQGDIYPTYSLSPPAILFLGFLLFIAIGTVLLSLPVAAHSETGFIQALFTATSAVTVTGLVVLDTGTHFTVFGQVVIAVLIQVGGIGFMTFAVIAALSLGVKLDLKQQIVMKETMGETSIEKVVQTAKLVVIYALFIELVGFIALLLVWWESLGLREASYQAFFYTISAFNNAGFALKSDSLSSYVGNGWVNLIITALFIIGGIGFTVLIDLHKNFRWRKLSLNTRLVLSVTLGINLIAFVLIWLLEANNANTLAGMSTSDQALASWFQAVTPRTAGFNTLPIDQLTDATTTLTILLMFIGGGSLSTASGIKLGTFIVIIMATYAFLRRREHVTIMERTLPLEQVMKAFALTVVSCAMAFFSVFLLTAIEDAPFIDILFEVVSALSTVGLSRGLTAELSKIGEVVIIFMMLVGRIGPLTFVYFLAMPKPRKIKYADARIQIG